MSTYQAPNIEEIHRDMLSNVPGNYDREAGGFTYDLTKTYSLESYEIHKRIEEVFSKLDITNFSGEELDRQVFQKKGISRKQATYAIGEVLVKGSGSIPEGSLFETEAGTQFQTIEEVAIITETLIPVRAVNPGSSGNIPEDQIVLIPITIPGITEVTNPEKTYDGFDEETDLSLIERYLIEVQKPATSGNVYHYMKWAREVPGIGDSRIFPLWDGDNTVKILVIDEDKLSASPELVEAVQNYIDPKGNEGATWGAGYGEAPIGAYCTVESARGLPIDINITADLEEEYVTEAAKKDIQGVTSKYLRETAFASTHVSYSILSSRILDIEGIKEWSDFTINGGRTNIPIASDQVAETGSVVVNGE